MFSSRSETGSMGWSRAIILSLAVIALLVLSAASPLPVQALETQEYQLKAALIYNIAKFVEWPAETLQAPGEPMVLYIMGEDRFQSAFDPFEQRTIKGRPFEVRKIETWEDIPDDCQILFISVYERLELQRILDKIADRAILTISDEPGFGEWGAIIGLVTESNKVRFTVNTSSARGAGLKLSSNLLKLARSIYGEAR